MTTANLTDSNVAQKVKIRTTVAPSNSLFWLLLERLGSLKLTVGLLILAVFMIWVASLQQTRNDIWAVKSQHFSSVLVRIPFNVFFPPAWFPGLQSLQGNCYLPSGITVLVAMIVNLVAAHLFRMRIQAKGLRLWAGWGAALLGITVTWMVIFNGQNAEGFQGEAPPAFFRRLWLLIEAAILGVGLIAGFAGWRMPRERMVARISLGFIAVFFLASFSGLWALGDSAFIGDSAMRILWQLIQGTMAAAVMMVACNLLFKRKGAVVLVHIGLLLLMVNEVYVSLTNQEQQMYIAEGETSSMAVDIRHVELVIADVSNPDQCRIVTVPASRLQTSHRISAPELPFDISVSRYMVNADLIRKENGSSSRLEADSGLGKVFEAVELPPTAATGNERKSDRAAAYVQFFQKDIEISLGKYLVSMLAYENEVLDSVSIGEKTFYFGLRNRTELKPYEVRLVNAEKTTYPGTMVPKSFSSDLLLTDRDRGLIDSPQRVWMNNPLRYGNETFYQSGMDELNGREYTVLQIVKNSGWMIPYVACMFVVLGLVVQFASTLEKTIDSRTLRHLEKPNSERLGVRLAVGWMVLLGMGLFLAREIMPAVRTNLEFGGLRLDKLARLPILFEGRLQPLDSLARNTARQLSGRETVLGHDGEKKPAIRWLADTIFRYPGWEKYRVLRITDLNVLNELGLTPASPFLYSFEDLTKETSVGGVSKPRFEVLTEQAKNADQLPPEKLSIAQKRLLDLKKKITLVKNLQVALGDPAELEQQEGFLARLQIGASLAASSDLPLTIPVDQGKEGWTTTATALNRRWLAEYGNRLGAVDGQQLAQVVFADKLQGAVRNELLNQEVMQLLQADPEVREIIERIRGREEAERDLVTELKKLPPDKMDSIRVQAEQNIEEKLEPIAQRYRDELQSQIDAIGFDPLLAKSEWSEKEIPAKLSTLYLNKNSEEFNKELQHYLDQFPKYGLGHRSLGFEMIYNLTSPFYLAMVFYLVGVVLTALSFVGYSREIGKVSWMVIVIGLIIQIVGIVLRVIISGRPPVTTLYSSVIFVSACSVGLLLIVEKLTRINVGNFLAGVAGFGMLNWAWSMSVKDGDTFTVLVAVLDTQFWLSTHVICISLGYVATIAGGAVGAAALVLWLIGYLRRDLNLRIPTLQRMSEVIYGIVCFGLLFSFFGTVLGGLWADDSWGRFWGWDTKENGALMIVFWNAVLLHARWAGLVRFKGIAALSTLGIAITFWSWQGVNLLGVGLHNYGFSEEGLQVLVAVVVACLTVSMIGLIPHPPIQSQSRTA